MRENRWTSGVVPITAGALAALLGAAAGQAQEPAGYLTPPREIVDILDAPAAPQVVVSPTGDTVALLERPGMPPLSELAQPMLRLAGYRINPRTNGPHTTAGARRITLRPIGGGAEHVFDAPVETSLARAEFSPDGSRLLFTLTRYNGIEAWVMEVASGQVRPLSDTSINATWGDPCDWLDQNATVVCRFKASARGAPPTAPDVPAAPNIQQHSGGAAPIRTYQDLLQNAHDEALFEYYFTTQIATIDLATGQRTAIGRPGLYRQVSASPSGRYFLTVEVERPFSWLVTAGSFPKDVTIRNRSGEVVSQIAQLPLADAVPIGGVPTGPRSFVWNPTEPHTLVWAEAQDGGDPRRTAPVRDHVYASAAPFSGAPRELARTEYPLRRHRLDRGGRDTGHRTRPAHALDAHPAAGSRGSAPHDLGSQHGRSIRQPRRPRHRRTARGPGDPSDRRRHLPDRSRSLPRGGPAVPRPRRPAHVRDRAAVPERRRRLRDGRRPAVG